MIKLALQIILAIFGLFKKKAPPHPGSGVRKRQDQARMDIQQNKPRRILKTIRDILLAREAKKHKKDS